MAEFISPDALKESEDFGMLRSAIHAELRRRPARDRLLYPEESLLVDSPFLDTYGPENIEPMLGTSPSKEQCGITGIVLTGYREMEDDGTRKYALEGTDENFVLIPVPTSVSQSIYRTLERGQKVCWMQYAYALRHAGLTVRYERMLRNGKGNALRMQQRIYGLEDAYRRIMKGLLSTQAP